VLLAASYLFYGWWDWRFCALMAVSSAIDFVAAHGVANGGTAAVRRLWLGMSLAVNLGMLGFFKYFGFFTDSLADALGTVGLELGSFTSSVILPVGISFYTFQTMSYTIDVYRRQLQPTQDFVAYLTYVSFFPQLVAGPIERAGRMLPQFTAHRRFDPARAYAGCIQMLWGFFKKFAIADNLARIVDAAYSDPSAVSGVTLGVATVAFAVQIYCDFSGYSDIAIGWARLFGLDLSRNFRYPYFATSMTDFWSRWHISLSTWFRDYVYIPLGGNRVAPSRRSVNVMATFLLSGLWHGAAWNFVVWGGLNGLVLLVAQWRRDRGLVLAGPEWLSVLSTFALTCVLWVFFRAANFADALHILQAIPLGLADPAGYREAIGLLTPTRRDALLPLMVAALWYVEWRNRDHAVPILHTAPTRPRAAVVGTALLWLSLWLGPWSSTQFIYFQF